MVDDNNTELLPVTWLYACASLACIKDVQVAMNVSLQFWGRTWPPDTFGPLVSVFRPSTYDQMLPTVVTAYTNGSHTHTHREREREREFHSATCHLTKQLSKNTVGVLRGSTGYSQSFNRSKGFGSVYDLRPSECTNSVFSTHPVDVRCHHSDWVFIHASIQLFPEDHKSFFFLFYHES